MHRVCDGLQYKYITIDVKRIAILGTLKATSAEEIHHLARISTKH